MLANRSMPRCTVIPELAYPDMSEGLTGSAMPLASHCVCESGTTGHN